VTLRPLRHSDGSRWREVRRRNTDWLQEWEATLPSEAIEEGDLAPTFGMMVRRLKRDARERRSLPWVISYQGRLVGQLTVGGMAWGSLRGAYIGYWIDREVAGRGITTQAVAMALDYCFDVLHLHRIEINIRPENVASLRVVEKLGIRREGARPAYLHINGQWRDHVTFVANAGDFPNGILTQLKGAEQRF